MKKGFEINRNVASIRINKKHTSLVKEEVFEYVVSFPSASLQFSLYICILDIIDICSD